MKKGFLMRWAASMLLTLFTLLLTAGAVSGQKPGTSRNPLEPYNGADPWLTYYEGNYYLATTT